MRPKELVKLGVPRGAALDAAIEAVRAAGGAPASAARAFSAARCCCLAAFSAFSAAFVAWARFSSGVWTASFLACGAVRGITTVQGMPRRPAA